MQNLLIKPQLHRLCMEYIQQRIATAQSALELANTSANEESKSSAGDKYETTREMLQQQIEKDTAALTEAIKQKQLLLLINPDIIHNEIKAGSLVSTDKNNFYIAISAGSLVVHGKKYTAVSPSSPVGLKMMGKQAGESFNINNISHSIVSVC